MDFNEQTEDLLNNAQSNTYIKLVPLVQWKAFPDMYIFLDAAIAAADVVDDGLIDAMMHQVEGVKLCNRCAMRIRAMHAIACRSDTSNIRKRSRP